MENVVGISAEISLISDDKLATKRPLSVQRLFSIVKASVFLSVIASLVDGGLDFGRICRQQIKLII